MPPRHWTGSESLKLMFPRNAFRTVIRPTFPVRRIADCQPLASQDVHQRKQRAKLAAASLNRSRLCIDIEADPQMVFTRKKEDQAPSIRGRRFRAIFGALRQPAKCTVLGPAKRYPFRYDKARLSK